MGAALQPSRGGGRSHLKLYAECIAYWLARYDTAEIAAMTRLPEATVAAWVANFRDLTFAGRAAGVPVA